MQPTTVGIGFARLIGMFLNRQEAGKCLAQALKRYRWRNDVVVLALPRGGVPVAAEVAKFLEAPLDWLAVRKLGVPGLKEFAMGAIAEGGEYFLDHALVAKLRISEELVRDVFKAERQELERRQTAYRKQQPAPELKNKVVVLVDDGLATGATMQAAVRAVKARHPRCVIVAVPVSSRSAQQELRPQVDEFVTVLVPDTFRAVGNWYQEFPQVADEEVISILHHSPPAPEKHLSAAS